MTNILDRILQLREEKGWTEYQLRVESGIPPSTISSWFRKNDSRPSTLWRPSAGLAALLSRSFFADRDAPLVYPSPLQAKLLNSFSHLTVEQQERLVHFLESCKHDPL